MTAITKYHPVTLVGYSILLVTMLMSNSHPIILTVYYIFLLCWLMLSKGMHHAFKEWLFGSSIILFFMILLPMNIHDGESLLFFMNDQAITKEAFFYAYMVGLKIACIAVAIQVIRELLPATKLFYVFYRLSPLVALGLMKALRLSYDIKKQIQEAWAVQRTLQHGVVKSRFDRIKYRLQAVVYIIGDSFEQLFALRSIAATKNYGVGKRNSFAYYQLQKKDGLLFVIAVGSVCIPQFYSEYFAFHFFPSSKLISYHWSYLISFLLVIFPIIIELKERIVWHYLQSKI